MLRKSLPFEGEVAFAQQMMDEVASTRVLRMTDLETRR